jgi:hypothetical protein
MHIRYNFHVVKHNINNNDIISGYTLSAILTITNKYHILIKISGWKIRSSIPNAIATSIMLTL